MKKMLVVIIIVMVCMLGFSVYKYRSLKDSIEYERMYNRDYELYVWDEDITLFRLTYYEVEFAKKYMENKEPLEKWTLLDWDKVHVYDKDSNLYVTFEYYVNRDVII